MTLRMELPEVLRLSPRVAEYCNHPAQGVTGAEGEATEDHVFVSVHILTRHGSRTSMSEFKNHPNPSIPCALDTLSMLDHPKLLNFVPTVKAYADKHHPNSSFNRWSLFPNKSRCLVASLTGQGALQLLLLGQYLNERYIQKRQLFNGEFSPDDILVRSTKYPRTYQSAIALLYGFLPRFNLTELDIHAEETSFLCNESYVNLTCRCPAIFYQPHRVTTLDDTRKETSVYKGVTKYIAKVYGLRKSELTTKSAMMDILMSQVCHGVEPKCNARNSCITHKTLEDLWSHLDPGSMADLLDPIKRRERKGRVALHPLLVEIANRMKAHSIKMGTMPRFVLCSGHDTILAPLTITLGIHAGTTPPYCKSINL